MFEEDSSFLLRERTMSSSTSHVAPGLTSSLQLLLSYRVTSRRSSKEETPFILLKIAKADIAISDRNIETLIISFLVSQLLTGLFITIDRTKAIPAVIVITGFKPR